MAIMALVTSSSANGDEDSVPLDEGMPDINPDKVCFIIVKAREFAAGEDEIETDASNDTDDQFASILSQEGSASVEAELKAFIDQLDEDEQIALTALMWIGRGDYEASDWKNAVIEAGSRRTGSTTDYLLGTPLLPDYLELALGEFGASCTDFEVGRL
jgi:Protein of unknown function (DUF3775)